MCFVTGLVWLPADVFTASGINAAYLLSILGPGLVLGVLVFLIRRFWSHRVGAAIGIGLILLMAGCIAYAEGQCHAAYVLSPSAYADGEKRVLVSVIGWFAAIFIVSLAALAVAMTISAPATVKAHRREP